MKKQFDLVHYPFNTKKEDVLLFRSNNNFEFRFTNDVFSKKITSNCIENAKTYLEIEIIDGECKILSETNKLHEFTEPAGFYVDVADANKNFYKNIHKNIISENLNDLCEYAIDLDSYLKNNDFPECPVPIVSTSAHFENFTRESAENKLEIKIYNIQLKFGDRIPVEGAKENSMLILRKYGQEVYDMQSIFLSNLFNLNKIAKYNFIKEEYERVFIEGQRNIFKHDFLKSCLSDHAFFYVSGPWRHCWVKFGYDPRSDPQNYKYQTIVLKRSSRSFQLLDKPSILTIVEENVDWYVTKECDIKNGFISKALKNLIMYELNVKDTSELMSDEIEEYTEHE